MKTKAEQEEWEMLLKSASATELVRLANENLAQRDALRVEHNEIQAEIDRRIRSLKRGHPDDLALDPKNRWRTRHGLPLPRKARKR